ncbi:non-ribosomal peptide synthetase component F [Streptomyces demainii]|uniref:Non-ribosomal peptide synthetase component F n=1 Tax=Streptomyces demainii TaxID=588122 RepID=A0ABT9L6N3_9ACTN|nr:non-ribosomal peptide synthetase component F [Streptomyces demainii]
METYTGALERFTVDAEVSRRLSTLSQSEGTTPFVTLLTTFQILLSRYTGQLDIAVAVPVLGRSRPDLDPLIGCFVNTLPVRVDLSGNPTFREALERVGDQTLDAFDHMDTSSTRSSGPSSPSATRATRPWCRCPSACSATA